MDGGSTNNHDGGAPGGAVLGSVIAIISEMLEDWGTAADDVTADTLLAGDLGFASVDLIHLVVAIEEHFGQGRLNFQELLIKDGRYVDDLSIGEIAAFVSTKLRR